MRREFHVRFCEGGGVRFPSATRRNIYVRSRRAGERVMASVSRFLTSKLRLKVNEAKSAVARPEERKFLGFSISNDGSERRIAPKALDKFKGRIRDMTRRTRGFSLQQLIKELKPYIVGWRGYFGFCQTPRSPHKSRSVDPSKIAYVSLAAMANQAKPLRGVTPSWRSKVPGGGRRWFTNRALAHVRTSGGPASPTQRLFRVARSSPNLCARQSLTRSNRRGTGPVCPVVWEGWRREASPYPDLGREAPLQGRFEKDCSPRHSRRSIAAEQATPPEAVTANPGPQDHQPAGGGSRTSALTQSDDLQMWADVRFCGYGSNRLCSSSRRRS